jgi:small subunit ribosomal protein S4
MKINSYLNRLKLRRFYGSITKQELKKVIEKAALNTNVLGRSFIYLLESRLDVILYRANFFSSIMAARQYINHKKVFVNGILANKPSQRLFLNDIINISDPLLVYNQLQQRLINKKLLINYPVYLEVNYRLGSIILTKMPLNDEVPYPFFININSIAHNF